MNPGQITPNPGYTPIAKEIMAFPMQSDKLISLITTPYAQDYYFEKSNVKVQKFTGQAGLEGKVQYVTRDKQKRTYIVDDRAVRTFVDRRTEQSAKQQEASDIQEATEDLTEIARTIHEIRGSLVLTNDDNYDAVRLLTGVNAGPGANEFVQWALPNTGDPIADMYTLLTRLGAWDPALSQLRIGLGVDAMNIIATHDKILEATKYTRMGGRAGPQDLKELFSKWWPVEEVMILQAETEDEDETATKIWPTTDVFAMVTQKGTPAKPKKTFAATMRQIVDGEDIAVYTTPTSEGAHGGTEVKVALSETFLVVDKKLGGRLKTAVEAAA